MENSLWALRTAAAVQVIALVAVAAVLMHSISSTRRSLLGRALKLCGLYALSAGTSLFVVTHPPQGWGSVIALTMLSAVTVVASVKLFRLLPRLTAAHDRANWRAASRQLRHSKERFERAVDGSQSGLWEWNLEANSAWYSPRFRELLGYASESEFPNEFASWLNALHPDDTGPTCGALTKHLEAHAVYDVEHRLRNKDGSYRWYNIRGFAQRNEDGPSPLMSGSIHDIDARVRAEQAIRRRDEYLNQKQKMEALGELAGEAAHEFNNLLAAIGGQVQMARRSLLQPSTAAGDLDLAISLVQQAAVFSRQLLDIGRHDPTQIEIISLNAVVQRLFKVARPLLAGHVNVKFTLDERVGPVRADAARLQQALLNLCINARDAMTECGTVSILTRHIESVADDGERPMGAPPGRYETVRIRDTGCGLTAEAKQRIFEPFYTTKSVGKGSGLGLAVTYGIVKEFHGYIEVVSAPGEGCEFIIWFPAIGADTGDGQPVLDAQSSQASILDLPIVDTSIARVPLQTPRGTILFAEDDERIREATSRMLETNGYRVVPAAHGLEAIERFRRHGEEIDVALLDIMMPHLRGDEVFAQLRAHKPDLPVVFCTGYLSQHVREEFLHIAGVWMLEKPFTMATLLQTLGLALTARDGGSAEVTTEEPDCRVNAAAQVLVVDDERLIRQQLSRALAAAGVECECANNGEDACQRYLSRHHPIVVTDLRMPQRNGHSLAVVLLDQPTPPKIVALTGVTDPRLAQDLMNRGVTEVVFKPTDYAALADRLQLLLAPSSDHSPLGVPLTDSQNAGHF